MPEPHLPRRASAAVPLIAVALAGGACRSEAESASNVAAAVAPKALPSPTEIAQRLVRERVGAAVNLIFAEPQIFNSAGATIVCGRVSDGGQPAQRYIAVGEQDVFVESQMEPGHMDQATQEFCKAG